MQEWGGWNAVSEFRCPFLPRILGYNRNKTGSSIWNCPFIMCAWHDAQADLLAQAGSKTSAVAGRKDNANKARACSETACLEEA